METTMTPEFFAKIRGAAKALRGSAPGAGHNVGGVDADRLRSLTDRIIRLETEKRERADDIKDLYAEAKSGGYATDALRDVVKEMLETDKQRAKRRARAENADIMRHALGPLADTGLGAAAIERAGQ